MRSNLRIQHGLLRLRYRVSPERLTSGSLRRSSLLPFLRAPSDRSLFLKVVLGLMQENISMHIPLGFGGRRNGTSDPQVRILGVRTGRLAGTPHLRIPRRLLPGSALLRFALARQSLERDLASLRSTPPGKLASAPNLRCVRRFTSETEVRR